MHFISRRNFEYLMILRKYFDYFMKSNCIRDYALEACQVQKEAEFHLTNACNCVYSLPAAFRSFNNLTTWSGIGGATGKWAPFGWNPFSSATQVTVTVVPSGCLYEYDPLETVPASSRVICFWAPDSSTLMPFSVS